MLISLIVPIHNEQDGLARFWQAVSTTLEQSGYAFEVVMVDDGSTDESWQLISELTSAGQSSIDVTAIRLSRNSVRRPLFWPAYAGLAAAQPSLLMPTCNTRRS
ncbi:MAG: glycosyltransferase [gamma proteobacterium symbiont of Ctena orbiculata]|uniref:Undecaprenyl-phosphate 4-deoxy-4-formamido-L-arabinose transferase n=1 Tax=Candidatus Thiodiazotropha endolucinida TaxID=1655433 RepID=A0A7Z0VKQ4_9GAMM|nr:undecaprenyl-phosphate 4-deoxy-4-formamido-L-arabinose transferase [Candidatus Thiodiazotropha endolucinida]